jgi:uncharacterized membrane protein YhhN
MAEPFDYAGSQKLPRDEPLWWPPAVSVALMVIVAPLCMCMCGHLDRRALPVTIGSAALAVYGWACSRARFPWRAVHMIVAVFAIALLFKNAADVLWYGHNPIFR